jgi:pimeloyl-ACP methyl ester carboxylesterase
MDVQLKTDSGFKFIETQGNGKTLLLLHGLFGALSNFEEIISAFGTELNVIVPILPIYNLPTETTGLGGLLNFTKEFVEYKELSNIHVLGNSLGGHIAQLFALDHPELVKTMTLTGSSGLFESGMGDGYPRRGDYDYIKRKTEETFFDPTVATKELIDEVYETVNDRNKAIRIVLTAKSALQHNLGDKIHNITCPSLLVWGNQDTITPPFVGEQFKELLPNSELHFLDNCGHAPMMERPNEFNSILNDFLNRHE